ncbi:MAG: glycoside hydrolase family 65 protein [Candidatus Omnitrophica bacterium]|nr:glycoside hydrolase family 65 protein [Candidatus Omnitrophota bacterium]
MEKFSNWKLTYKRFQPAQEQLREALCTLANGYFGTRAAAPEATASKIHYPGTYVAGLYNKLETCFEKKCVTNEDMVNCPQWNFVTFRAGDEDWFCPSTARILTYRMQLHMKDGVVSRTVRFRTAKGARFKVESRMLIHLERMHLGAIEYKITPENYHGEITVRTMLDGAVENLGVARYRQLNSKHLQPCANGRFQKNGVYLSMKTSQSGVEIAEAERVRVFQDNKEISPRIRPVTRRLMKGRERIGQEWKMQVKENHTYTVEKIVALYTSRDKKVKRPVHAAVKETKRAPSFPELFQSHVKAWHRLWGDHDIHLEGDAFAQMALRFHTFHLLQVATAHNAEIDAGIPARGLHGEAYRGHVFWDEVFVFPFYDFHQPEVAKALFLYRYRRLDQARKLARANRFKGAMFPWQSGASGEEETQEIHLNPLSGKWGPDYSRLQRHISFIIAFNIWEYWKITGDYAFLKQYGAETFLEIARLAESLAEYDEKDQRFHIRGVMGPDEFHEMCPGSDHPGLDDNAYTNVMAVWVLRSAAQILEILNGEDRESLKKKLSLKKSELTRWGEITKKMKVLINDDGIISQFQGYFSLKELNWKAYRAEYKNIQRMDRILKAEGKYPDEYKVAKQADVLMIFYLFPFEEVRRIFKGLGYEIDLSQIRKNFRYYEQRTSHGSTLSKVVHCYLAHELGMEKKSMKWFHEVMSSDVHDIQGGTTPEGIHCGVMGGSIDILVRRFAGVTIQDGILCAYPRVPRKWKRLRFRLRFQDAWYIFSFTSRYLTLRVERVEKNTGKKVKVRVYGKEYSLPFRKSKKFSLKKR